MPDVPERVQDTELKLILPAREIPIFSFVTKRTGTKRYVLRDRLRMFDEYGKETEIHAPGGSRMLVAEGGDINVVDGQTELAWLTNVQLLKDWIEGLEGDEQQ